MRVLVIGATGTIGSAVADAFAEAGHDVLRASRNGEQKVDIGDPASIRALYESVGRVDAIVNCAGNGVFKALPDCDHGDLQQAYDLKLTPFFNVVRLGLEHLNDGGQFIITSGIFATQPMPGVSLISMVNGALESFTRAAALDMPRGIRINAVSPPFIKETAEKMGMPGGYPARDNARAYAELANSTSNGVMITPGS
jgi:NAD(P)-dependent dehydrogenase (short-subunit alcohol dehydrogenase family)